MGRKKSLVLLLSATTGIVVILWGVGVIGGNFREVVPGRLYRSAQLTGGNLERALRDYRIKSVVNLRGARPGQGYYESERAICRREGVEHVDIDMSARHLPRPGAMIAMVSAFDRLPRPILIHCEGGSDRSGLAATVYETVEDGEPLNAAQARDLSWRYGHLAFTRSGQLDRFFDLYRQTHGVKSFKRWIEEDYPRVYQGLASKP